MTNYPQDEFDKVPETSNRQGVHRARMAAPRGGGLGPVIFAAGLALAVGLLSFFVLPLLGAGGGTEASVAATATTAPASTAAASTTAPAEEPATPSRTPGKEPADEPSKEPEEPAGPSEAAVPAGADKSDSVLVLNGTGTSGLGAGVSATVSSNGWQIAGVDNWTGAALANSVIFYNPGQEANARELSALLNIGDVRATGQGEISQGLTVVLGPGFQ